MARHLHLRTLVVSHAHAGCKPTRHEQPHCWPQAQRPASKAGVSARLPTGRLEVSTSSQPVLPGTTAISLQAFGQLLMPAASAAARAGGRAGCLAGSRGRGRRMCQADRVYRVWAAARPGSAARQRSLRRGGATCYARLSGSCQPCRTRCRSSGGQTPMRHCRSVRTLVSLL
jgi:hypothetical protein